MTRYHDTVIELERQRSPRYDHQDSHSSPAVSVIAPGYERIGVDFRDTNNSALTRASHGHSHRHAASVIEEPVVEHEHHHLHHHIDHGDVSGRSIALSRGSQRPGLDREYSYDDLDVQDRRFSNGSAISIIHEHDHRQPAGRRRRHRHRSRHGSRTRISRSEVDLTRISGEYEQERDDVTVVDVPVGTRRIYVNVDKQAGHREREGQRERESQREREVDWRREHGIRRSRGLGNELWTEITKDLVTREAIEDRGYPYEETDFFYYIFEYLDSDQITDLRELTEYMRHEKVRHLEYHSIAGSQRSYSPKIPHSERDYDDARTEIIIENSHTSNRDRPRHRYRY